MDIAFFALFCLISFECKSLNHRAIPVLRGARTIGDNKIIQFSIKPFEWLF